LNAFIDRYINLCCLGAHRILTETSRIFVIAPLSLHTHRHHLANNSVKMYPAMEETRALSECKVNVERKKA
jgi:hypothetical protein